MAGPQPWPYKAKKLREHTERIGIDGKAQARDVLQRVRKALAEARRDPVLTADILAELETDVAEIVTAFTDVELNMVRAAQLGDAEEP